jgi:hypothetical protein
MTKKLEAGSKYENFDQDQDGIVSDAEMERAEQIVHLENQDKKEDAQRKMAWVALIGMISYPFVVIIAVALGLDASILASMADLYFISVAGILAAFYGKEAYMSRHSS